MCNLKNTQEPFGNPWESCFTTVETQSYELREPIPRSHPMVGNANQHSGRRSVDQEVSSSTPPQSFNRNHLQRILDIVRSKEPSDWLLPIVFLAFIAGFSLSAGVHDANAEAASGQETSLSLTEIRWDGSLLEAAGRTVDVRFTLYQDPVGETPLWSELQTIKVRPDGSYSVLLGAASDGGFRSCCFRLEARGGLWQSSPVHNRTLQPRAMQLLKTQMRHSPREAC
jgi:hypothetical protein